jgi:hypothetical protein
LKFAERFLGINFYFEIFFPQYQIEVNSHHEWQWYILHTKTSIITPHTTPTLWIALLNEY